MSSYAGRRRHAVSARHDRCVKAVNASGAELWLSAPAAETHCLFGSREEASVFRKQQEAQARSETLGEKCNRFGFLVEVDSA
jgi:hypothetical protein